VPQRRTAIKDLRKNRRRQMMNLDLKSDLKKTLKQFTTAASAKAKDSKDLLKTVYKKLDKAAKRNVMHKRTASRRKAKFAKMLAAAK
jgi:small subunit ribosomal protein S20